MNIKEITAEIQATESQMLEHTKATYRCEGALLILNKLLTQVKENASKEKSDKKKSSKEKQPIPTLRGRGRKAKA